MIIPTAYILLRFFKRFPIVLVAIMLSHSCFVTTIIEENKVEEQAEVYANAIHTSNQTKVEKEEPLSYNNRHLIKTPLATNIGNKKFKNLYCKTAYHKLSILYLNIAIERQLI